MPLSPPYYMFADREPQAVTMSDLLGAFVDRVLAIVGCPAENNWGAIS